MLDLHLDHSSASFDVPYQSSVWLNTPEVGEADAVHVRPPNTTTEFAVTVLASPTTGDWWTTAAVDALFLAIDGANQEARRRAPVTPTAVIHRVAGVFGTEIHTLHHVHPTSDVSVRDLVIVGRSGPGWTVKITAYGIDVTDADVDTAYQIMASTVVGAVANRKFFLLTER